MALCEYHLHITGPEIDRKTVLKIGVQTIGRQPGVDILLEHPLVSRTHAQLITTEKDCQILDLGSSNGTHVNGEPLTPNIPVILPEVAVIKIGPFTLSLEAQPVESSETVIPAPHLISQLPDPPPVALEQPPLAQSDEATVDDLAGELSPAKESGHDPDKQPFSPPELLTPDEILSIIQSGFEPPEGHKNGYHLNGLIPPGLDLKSRRLINYLPGIYHTDFMARFLAIFEAILTPAEWNIDNFDLYLDPGTAPEDFLPWLAQWYQVSFDPTWSESKQRMLLKEAHQIFARRGTPWALKRVLEIYTGHPPEIIDDDDQLEPYAFIVKLPISSKSTDRTLVEHLINANKPAHTSYKLEFAG
jgi:phage tail-like protein